MRMGITRISKWLITIGKTILIIACSFYSFSFFIIFILSFFADELSTVFGVISLVIAGTLVLFVRKLINGIKINNRNNVSPPRIEEFNDNVVQPQITNQEPPASLIAFYDQMKIQDELRIINDCLDLVQNSKNLDTVISRIELGARKAYLLQQLEQAGLYKDKPTSADLIERFIGQKPHLLNVCIDKAYTDMLKNAKNLKTAKGKENRYKKFIDDLHRYELDYTYENEEYIIEIERELNLLISLNKPNSTSR